MSKVSILDSRAYVILYPNFNIDELSDAFDHFDVADDES